MTGTDFTQTMAKGFTLVDFLVPWSGPYRVQGSIVEKVVGHLHGKATVAKLNVDEYQVAVGKCGTQVGPRSLYAMPRKGAER